jgi:hypothetical protein
VLTRDGALWAGAGAGALFTVGVVLVVGAEEVWAGLGRIFISEIGTPNILVNLA